MKKKLLTIILCAGMAVLTFSGCGEQKAANTPSPDTETTKSAETTTVPVTESADPESKEVYLSDGVYSAKFTTDSSMFHINEVYDDRGTLTVKNGEMMIHITLPSKNIVNLYPGSAEEAIEDEAGLLKPTEDKVVYQDGTEEEVYGFDVPVPALDEPFPLALIGTKGKWYDHEVVVSDPIENQMDQDQEAADHVADLIDEIYVQEWTDDTWEKCEEAKAAWDVLTDEEKEMVEGEYADPDYFGRDTGDASKDNPRNGDDIGEKELLVVSFGTSFNDSRAQDIGGIEEALEEAYPDWSVRRAFTAQIIINHIYARDGEKIDNVEQALNRAVENGVKELVVQPTHLMHGAEYDELVKTLETYEDKFDHVAIAEPLLGEVGSDASVINPEKELAAKAITAEALKDAGIDDLKTAKEEGIAFVFMGHGTSHTASVTYDQMQTQMDALSYDNVFIGTVEGEPEDTSLETVIDKVKDGGYQKVILRPLMVVAGDHANNDMAGDEDDSWKSGFVSDGSFESIDCQIAGLGRIEDIQKAYVEHTGRVIQ